jgi:hypothetical protein
VELVPNEVRDNHVTVHEPLRVKVIPVEAVGIQEDLSNLEPSVVE